MAVRRTHPHKCVCGHAGPQVSIASFLQAAQRERFRLVAIERDIPFIILSCHASTATLRTRLADRERAGLDPSEATRAVLDHQLATQEPLTPQEEAHALRIDTDSLTSVDDVVDAVQLRLLGR